MLLHLSQHNIRSQDIIHWNDNENKVEMFLIKIFLIVEDMQERHSQDSGDTACHFLGKHTLFHGPGIPGGYTVTLQKLQQTSILSSPIVSVPKTLTPQTAGESNVIGNAVNIKHTGMNDSNKNHSYIHNVINIHVHFGVKCCSKYIFH